MRRLRRSCVHDLYDTHDFPSGVPGYGFTKVCPGGEFLPEGALVVEPGAALVAEVVHGPGPDRLRELIGEYQRERFVTADWVTSNIERLALIVELALASQVGESER